MFSVSRENFAGDGKRIKTISEDGTEVIFGYEV